MILDENLLNPKQIYERPQTTFYQFPNFPPPSEFPMMNGTPRFMLSLSVLNPVKGAFFVPPGTSGKLYKPMILPSLFHAIKDFRSHLAELETQKLKKTVFPEGSSPFPREFQFDDSPRTFVIIFHSLSS